MNGRPPARRAFPRPLGPTDERRLPASRHEVAGTGWKRVSGEDANL